MKGEMSMNPENMAQEEINPESIEFEPEWDPDTPQHDKIFVMDGRGRAIEVEVPDDD